MSNTPREKLSKIGSTDWLMADPNSDTSIQIGVLYRMAVALEGIKDELEQQRTLRGLTWRCELRTWLGARLRSYKAAARSLGPE